MKIFTKLLASASGMVLIASGAALAQDDTAPENEKKLETVTVTGSFIAGTPEDAALPVDVISAEDMKLQGSPSALDMIKSLPVSSGVLGDTNQFDGRAQGSEGSGTVNLRGLGASRTLVLLNGKRLAPNPFAFAGSGAVDTNILPLAAINRIEVLKDGAAAIYGSDAIAGVVNFITPENYTGYEVGGDYKLVQDSDGDYTGNIKAGWDIGGLNLFVAGGYQHRSELRAIDRDFAVRPFLENPQGGWSLVGNPGAFLPVSAAFTPVAGVTRDPACGTLGGQPLVSGTSAVCGFQFTEFDNMVEEENRYQVYSRATFDLVPGHKMHVEGFLSHSEVPNMRFSPSFPPVGGASGPTADASIVPGQFFVPATNPGFALLRSTNTGLIPATAAGAFLIATRPLGYGGNALAGGSSEISLREYDAFRVSADLSGDLREGLGYNFSLTYGKEEATRTNEDTIVNRYALALRGLGGTSCNVAANTPGANGCLWFNPFSNALPTNAATGAANPTFNSSVANSQAVLDYFLEDTGTTQHFDLFVAEAVLNGELGIKLGDGNVGWAAGMQFREEGFDRQYADINNLNLFPCIATITTGATNCAQPVGVFGFLAGARPLTASQNTTAFFAEVNLPFHETLTAQLAARHESYNTGNSTFDPKLSVKWQPVDAFALRGSIGSTFRGPALTQVAPGQVTSLQSVGGTFRAVDISGNPDLEPETADTYTVGAIFNLGGLRATVDYWNFDFQDPVITEPVAAIVAAVFPNGATGANNCTTAAAAALVARFSFTGACTLGNVSRVNTFYQNGPDITTNGVDVLASYLFEDFLTPGGEFEVGFSGSQVLEYEVGAFDVAGFPASPAFSALGKLNFQTLATPLPEKKFELYANGNYKDVNLRWTMRYIDGYEDQRTTIFTAPNANFPTAGILTPQGKFIKEFVTHDATLNMNLPGDIAAGITVENIFDKNPPFARLELNYDPFTGDGVGRTVKFSLSKKFGAAADE